MRVFASLAKEFCPATLMVATVSMKVYPIFLS